MYIPYHVVPAGACTAICHCVHATFRCIILLSFLRAHNMPSIAHESQQTHTLLHNPLMVTGGTTVRGVTVIG